MIGRILRERYEILEKIGDGGMSLVYRARDLQEKQTVAVKVLRPEHDSDEEFIRRFRREAEATQRLQHTHLVELYDISVDAPPYFLVMEYVSGVTLHQIIKEGPMPFERVVYLALQICEALRYAHEHQVIHRDIKPQNVLVAEGDLVKVSDFGIAVLVSQTTLMHTRSIIGSVHYFSPEQARGEPVTEQSDLYALGVVLYEMITGQVPFEGENSVAIALQHVQDEPQPLSELRPETPSNLEAIALHLLEKDTERRYQSAAEVLDDLEAVADELPQTPGSVYERMRRSFSPRGKNLRRQRVQRRIMRWVIGLMIIGCLFAGLAYGAWQILFPKIPELDVPNVQGMTLEQADATLNTYGLVYEVIEEIHDATQEAGVVLRQVQPPGQPVKNKVIGLVISRGRADFILPSVTDQMEREAVLLLEGKGLIVRTKPLNSPTIETGRVLDQIPRAQTVVYAGVEVTLIISMGPEQSIVPSVTGASYDDAVALLAAQGLEVGEVKIAIRNNDKYAARAVIEQNPLPETKVSKGAKVNLTLNTGESMVNISTIYFDTGAESQTILVVIDDASTTVASHREYLKRTYARGSSPLTIPAIRIQAPGVVRVYRNDQLLEEIEVK